MEKKNYLSINNSACVGCGQIIAARTVVNALGPDVIIANATGCLEITTGSLPTSAWGVPWIHSLFANAASVATGIYAGLQARGNKQTKVLVQAGDGSTFDIGLAAVSGMWNRNEPIIYVCYDNEIYANTGMQASTATQKGAKTTTSPVNQDGSGSLRPKKDLLAIALAHRLSYIAQTTSSHLDDLKAKILKAREAKGPSYIQVLSTCIPGWSVAVKDSVKASQLAADTGLYPLLEFIDGEQTHNWSVPKPRPKVEEYLQLQKRYAHLFKTEAGKEQIAWLQKLADDNVKKYNLD